MAFDREVRSHLMRVKNRSEVFGNQFFMDENDEIVGEEELLLISATDLPLDAAYSLALRHGGAAYPAHIDRDANGIVAILGTVPTEPAFTAVELRDQSNREVFTERYGLAGKHFVFSSDAHQLGPIGEAGGVIELDDEPYSSARVRRALIDVLRGEVQ